MPGSSDVFLKQLMNERDEQLDILREGKNARQRLRELNRLIAVYGGEAERLPEDSRVGGKSTYVPLPPVVPPNEDGSYVCPECGRDFSRPQGLGAHRKSAHQVIGRTRAEQ